MKTLHTLLWMLFYAGSMLARFWAVGYSFPRRVWFWPVALAVSLTQAGLIWPGNNAAGVSPALLCVVMVLEMGLYLLLHCLIFRGRPWQIIFITMLASHWDTLLRRIHTWGGAMLFGGATGPAASLYMLCGGLAACLAILWAGRRLARLGVAEGVTRPLGYGLAVLLLLTDLASTLSGDSHALTGDPVLMENTTVLLCVALALAGLVLCILHYATRQTEKRRRALEYDQLAYRSLLLQNWRAHQRLRHDLHNHLATAQGLLQDGHSEQAASYAAALRARAAALPRTEWCADVGVNTVLFAHMPALEAKGISVTVDARPVDAAKPLMAMAEALCQKALQEGRTGDSLLLRLRVHNGLAVAELSGLSGQESIRLVRSCT